MANLEAIVSRKTENDTQWKARQQADRENLMALQDAGVLEITSSAEAYTRYLELQGDNPAYSAGNIALYRSVRTATASTFSPAPPLARAIRWRTPTMYGRRRGGL